MALVRHRLRAVSFGAWRTRCAFARRPLREQHRHVQRRVAVAQGSREGDFPALSVAWTCQGLSLRGVFRPNALNVRLRDVLVEVDALTRVCAVLPIVALVPHGGRKGQENYTASRALILGAIPARRDTQRERMPGSPSERCTGRRRANWSWCS